MALYYRCIISPSIRMPDGRQLSAVTLCEQRGHARSDGANCMMCQLFNIWSSYSYLETRYRKNSCLKGKYLQTSRSLLALRLNVMLAKHILIPRIGNFREQNLDKVSVFSIFIVFESLFLCSNFRAVYETSTTLKGERALS